LIHIDEADGAEDTPSGHEDKLLGNRRRLAIELRRLRGQAGVSGRQLAERIGVSQSKISRIESGLAIPSGPEVAAWAAAVDASNAATALLTALTDTVYTEVHPWHAALQGQTHLQDEIQGIENRTGAKLTYEPSVVPGLLQTAEYARRVFSLFAPAYPEIDIPAVVAGRLDRQLALFDRARPFAFLITEGALRWQAGSPAVLHAQLDRIASLSTLENISIGLIPDAAPPLTYVPHGFVIFEPIDAHADALVMVETVHANLTVNDPVDVALYRRQWSLLEKMAVHGDDARNLLAEVAAGIRALPPADELPAKDDL
jgi:transcriptional regulator with XRE-family HTH domain